MKYYHSVFRQGRTMEALRERVEEVLKEEGFGVVTEIDLQKIMKEKLNQEYLPHIILGACHPLYAHKALTEDIAISTLLPCNVTLRQLEDGSIEIAVVNPAVAFECSANPTLKAILEEVQRHLWDILQKI